MGKVKTMDRTRVFLDPEMKEYVLSLGDKDLWVNRALRFMKREIERQTVNFQELVEIGNSNKKSKRTTI